eukprot:scaffold7357_cov195-Pinguiococcus_pyrenoidosus.AAC.15
MHSILAGVGLATTGSMKLAPFSYDDLVPKGNLSVSCQSGSVICDPTLSLLWHFQERWVVER